MATLWVICGAGQGVGKTHLAQSLCQQLSDSVYAKQGCGKQQEEKADNFFPDLTELAAFITPALERYSHVVVESNAFAREGKGSPVIFIEPLPAHTDIRPDADQLRKNAHIRIGEESSMADWRPILEKEIADPATVNAVGAVLTAQRERHLEISLAVRSKLWFTKDNLRVFGPGLARILEAVEKFGTLRKAVKAVQISYRHAWNMIKTAEEHLGTKLIVPQIGGTGGGGSTLAPEGKELLRIYREVNAEVADYAEKLFTAKLEAKWGPQRNMEANQSNE